MQLFKKNLTWRNIIRWCKHKLLHDILIEFDLKMRYKLHNKQGPNLIMMGRKTHVLHYLIRDYHINILLKI